MWTVFLSVDVILGVFPLRPVCPQEDPCARRDAAVLLFPLQDSVRSHQIIWITGCISANVDDTSRPNKFYRWYAVDRIVRKVLSRDPVHGRVEMGTSVLASLKSVPIPRRAALIVMR